MAMVHNYSKGNSNLLNLSIFFIQSGWVSIMLSHIHPSPKEPHIHITPRCLAKAQVAFATSVAPKRWLQRQLAALSWDQSLEKDGTWRAKPWVFSVKKLEDSLGVSSVSQQIMNVEMSTSKSFFHNNGPYSAEWVTQYVLDSFGGGNLTENLCISCYLTPFPSLWNQKTYFHQNHPLFLLGPLDVSARL